MSDLYLVHHGILGQRWGVRRYQNLDGTLTEEGKKRILNKINDNKKESSEMYTRIFNKETLKELNDKGVTFKNDDEITIKKGTEINRVSTAHETLDDKRKYASITDKDKREYIYEATEGMLGIPFGEKFDTYIYKATKDLKVATGEKIIKDLVNKQGSKLLKEYINEIEPEFGNNMKRYGNIVEGIDASESDEFVKLYDKQLKEDYNKIRSYFDNNIDTISKEYIKQGYDAITDIEDSGYADLPIVLLNPKDSIKYYKSMGF